MNAESGADGKSGAQSCVHPLGRVFDPEAQTRREFGAERRRGSAVPRSGLMDDGVILVVAEGKTIASWRQVLRSRGQVCRIERP